MSTPSHLGIRPHPPAPRMTTADALVPGRYKRKLDGWQRENARRRLEDFDRFVESLERPA